MASLKRRKMPGLNIDNNQVAGSTLKELLVDVPTSKLNLVKHKLTEQQCDPIRHSMVTKKDLQQIYLTQNELTNEALGMLAEGVAASVHLTVVSVSHNNLHQQNGTKFMRGLKNLKQI